MIERAKQSMLKLARRHGVEISRLVEAPQFTTLRNLAARHDADVIVDVGANEGQFARGLRSSGFTGTIVSLEPLAAAYERLKREAAGDADWLCLNVALSVASGQAEMGVAGNLGMSSSLLPMSATHERYAPSSRIVGAEMVTTIGWEDLAARLPAGPCGLKLDMQGFEGEVLRAPAAARFLQRVPMIVCEISCADLYEGAWSPAECLAFMADHGYGIFQMYPEWTDQASGRLLAMNGVFERG